MNPGILSRIFAAQQQPQEPQWGPNPYARPQPGRDQVPQPPQAPPAPPHFIQQAPGDLWGQQGNVDPTVMAMEGGGDMWDERAPQAPGGYGDERPGDDSLPNREMSPSRAMDLDYAMYEGDPDHDNDRGMVDDTLRQAGITQAQDPDSASDAPFYSQGGEMIPPSQAYYDELGQPPGPMGAREPGLNDLISMGSTEPDTWNGPTQVMDQSPLPGGPGPSMQGAPILDGMFGPPAPQVPPSMPRMTSR